MSVGHLVASCHPHRSGSNCVCARVMSSSAPSAVPAAAARPGGGGAQHGQQPQQDWRWTVAKSVLLYFAMQGVMGPNGLVAWYQGKSGLQQQQQQHKATPDSTPIPAQAGVQQPFAQPVQQLAEARVPSGTTASALFDIDMPLDFYVFVTADGQPSSGDIATQVSRLVPGGRGARNLTNVDLSDADVASFIGLPNEPAGQGTETWSSPTATARVLGAVRWSNVTLKDNKLQRDADLTIKVPDNVKYENGSIWAEIFAGPMGHPPNGPNVLRTRKLLTRLYPERKERQEKKLFDKSASNTTTTKSSSSALPFLDKEPARIISYWHNNLTLAIVEQAKDVGLPIASMPPPILQHVQVQEDENGEVAMPKDKVALNYPLVFPNDFWHMREHMHPINATHDTLPLHVQLYMTSFFKFQLLAAMSDSFDKSPGMAASEVDMVKLTLLENSPWYLGLTVGVSLLHSLFEFLAFSSEVSHWRKKDNMAGVSLGSILTNVIVQLIILLYLLDQAQDTSWMILASQAVGIVIEAWKLTKAVTVGVLPRKDGEGSKYLQWLPYRLDIRDKHVLSEEERKTQEFDKLAFRIVAMVAVPLLGAYTVYSALYQTHKGWWSFIIGTLCSFVYAFGFVSLIPQLIVNYKLKSTAGMNSKTFVYKILGTFVDDLFAFAIRQPWLHRLACFRDDVVFMVFLYQRWIYGVDPTRINEFGQVLERKEGAKEIGEEKDGKRSESKKDK